MTHTCLSSKYYLCQADSYGIRVNIRILIRLVSIQASLYRSKQPGRINRRRLHGASQLNNEMVCFDDSICFTFHQQVSDTSTPHSRTVLRMSPTVLNFS